MTARLAIFATHPIQYQVPWFQALAARRDVDLKVYYALVPDARQQGIGFGVPFQWDIPLLEGYAWERLDNARDLPDLGRFFGSSTPGVGRRLREQAPDAAIVTGWNAWPLLQALRACRAARVPVIVRGESNALRRRRLWVRAIHRMFLTRFDAFLAIGSANRRFYLDNGVPADKIFVAPYFVDNERFARSADAIRAQRARLRGEWGIAADALCVLFAGKLQPKKRPLDVVRAIASGPELRGKAHLLVAGTGELLDGVRATAAELGVHASFAGFLNQTQMPRAYVAADVLVLPSDHGETWGLVVNEAMACGVPAIVSDRVGCAEDLVEDGVTGRVVPFGDVGALAAALRAFRGDPQARARMGAAARAHVAGYSIQQAVYGTIAAVRSVLE
jgi:glycosyltransferase involved in cell wall biosynthesis